MPWVVVHRGEDKVLVHRMNITDDPVFDVEDGISSHSKGRHEPALNNLYKYVCGVSM